MSPVPAPVPAPVHVPVAAPAGTAVTYTVTVASDEELVKVTSYVHGLASGGTDFEAKLKAKLATDDGIPAKVKNFIVVLDDQIEPIVGMSDPSSDGMSGGAIAGTVIGGLCGVALIAALVVVFMKKQTEKESNNKSNGGLGRVLSLEDALSPVHKHKQTGEHEV
jgi:hypothetical protein